jgi:hypothetical protein
MSSKPKTINLPGPDHPITIERNRDRAVGKLNHGGPVQFIPMQDDKN